MKWFGPARFSRMCDDVERVPTPIGGFCLHCEEAVILEDPGYLVPHSASGNVETEAIYHVECFLRTITGSVGHQMRWCSCGEEWRKLAHQGKALLERQHAENAGLRQLLREMGIEIASVEVTQTPGEARIILERIDPPDKPAKKPTVN